MKVTNKSTDFSGWAKVFEGGRIPEDFMPNRVVRKTIGSVMTNSLFQAHHDIMMDRMINPRRTGVDTGRMAKQLLIAGRNKASNKMARKYMLANTVVRHVSGPVMGVSMDVTYDGALGDIVGGATASEMKSRTVSSQNLSAWVGRKLKVGGKESSDLVAGRIINSWLKNGKKAKWESLLSDVTSSDKFADAIFSRSGIIQTQWINQLNNS